MQTTTVRKTLFALVTWFLEFTSHTIVRRHAITGLSLTYYYNRSVATSDAVSGLSFCHEWPQLHTYIHSLHAYNAGSSLCTMINMTGNTHVVIRCVNSVRFVLVGLKTETFESGMQIFRKAHVIVITYAIRSMIVVRTKHREKHTPMPQK